MSLQPDLDRALSFIIPQRNARGRLVRLGPMLESILAAHGYPPVIEALMAEALVLTALLGAMLKDAGGQLTMQVQTEGGAVGLLVCDYRGGEVRGYIQHDADKLAELPVEPTLFALFGKTYLAITFDQVDTGERYQGIVPLDGTSLSEAVESYFSQSEQIPSLVRVGISGRIAGGLLLQHLAEGEDGRDRIHTRLDHPEWEHVKARGISVAAPELTDTAPRSKIWCGGCSMMKARCACSAMPRCQKAAAATSPISRMLSRVFPMKNAKKCPTKRGSSTSTANSAQRISQSLYKR